MKIGFFFFCILIIQSCIAQQTNTVIEEQMEINAEKSSMEEVDENWVEQHNRLVLHPTNLNTATVEELKELGLDDLRIEQLIKYRKMAGPLITKYEIQAIPLWDIAMIMSILPYITISDENEFLTKTRTRLIGGEHQVVVRTILSLEKSRGFILNNGSKAFAGKGPPLYMRYRYSYKNLLQYGILAESDAGEAFFQPQSKYGFDHYTMHLFMRNIGLINILALGDYTINMGQGLIHWNSQSFGKGSSVMLIKKQGRSLNPYQSSSEQDFFRGFGIAIKIRKVELTAFLSSKKVDASILNESITSFLTGGNHRTATEIKSKKNVGQIAGGMIINYQKQGMHLALNGIFYKFSKPIDKRDEPYNLYTIKGDNWINFSADGSYTLKNFHFFSEVAIDKRLNRALVCGVISAISSSLDISLLYKNISKQYQSISGNAITENALPTNENGVYACLSFQTTHNWTIESFFNQACYPWLKYLVNAPSYSNAYGFKAIKVFSKSSGLYLTIRNKIKQSNGSIGSQINIPEDNYKQNFRIQYECELAKGIIWRQRTELVLYRKNLLKDQGFSTSVDIVCKPSLKNYSFTGRIIYFDTDSYDARIYAFENDVGAGYTVPALAGNGYRYYLISSIRLARSLLIALKISRTNYVNQTSIGTGNDLVNFNHKTNMKVQLTKQW